jgi:hypothetical protein
MELYRKCEDALEEIEHAQKAMSDPYAPMNKWPIDCIDRNTAFLRKAFLTIGKIEEEPEEKQFPLLYKHLHQLKFQAQLDAKEQAWLASPEYQQQLKIEALNRDKQALDVELRNIDHYKKLIAQSEEEVVRLRAKIVSDVQKNPQ